MRLAAAIFVAGFVLSGCGGPGEVPSDRAREALDAARELKETAGNVPRMHKILERYRRRGELAAPAIEEYKQTGNRALLRRIDAQAPGVTTFGRRSGRPSGLNERAARDLVRAGKSKPRTPKERAQDVRRAASNDVDRLLKAVKGEPLEAGLGVEEHTVESLVQDARESARDWWPDLAAKLNRRLKKNGR
ncbi:MAG: hypothetical protein M3433_08205 [Actinomycetota bacterium]|nr:hypothetical protein [Actinomycetota bacterium]